MSDRLHALIFNELTARISDSEFIGFVPLSERERIARGITETVRKDLADQQHRKRQVLQRPLDYYDEPTLPEEPETDEPGWDTVELDTETGVISTLRPGEKPRQVTNVDLPGDADA
jgi:hypothetical protein